jgi:hypothetical protein
LALAAGVALYARQQSDLGATQQRVVQLGADLDREQAAARQLESRDATLEAETAELRLRLTQVAPTSAPAQPPESEAPEGFLIPHCVLYASEEVYRTAFAMNPWVHPQIIESFFTDPSVTATWEHGILYQMCYSGRHEVAFVVYGEFEGFEGTNNLIGIFTGERVIAHHLFNPSSGDIGLCALEGFIDRSVVYACRGGDGPAGWDTVSVLDGDSGESQVVRDCRFTQEGTHCTVDLLDLGG